MESSRTSLVSKTHFEVLGLGVEFQVLGLGLASKPQVLENCPVLGSRTALFFEQLKFRWKAPETSRKICEHLFCFPHLEHRRSQEGEARGPGPPTIIGISPIAKMWQKRLLFFQFQFLFSIFRLQQQLTTLLKTRGAGPPQFNFCQQILTYKPEEMESFRLKSCYFRPTSSFFMNVMH